MTAASPIPDAFSLQAPAKINWFLRVLRRRDDGFHEILSLMQKITLFDVLTFSPSQQLIVETDAQIPPEQNLVHRAALLLKDAYGIREGAHIRLQKNTPVGAGLGGGSSDAAAALEGLARLWSLEVPREELAVLAGRLGSDVPFFLSGPLSLAGGRGEVLTPVRAEVSMHLLLVKPPFPVSTAWAYGELGNTDLLRLTNKPYKVDNIEFLNRSIGNAKLEGNTGSLINDLESVTIRSFPVIDEIKHKMVAEGAILSLMSGSGPTVFGVFRSREKAENASGSFREYWSAVVQTITDKK